MRVSPRLPVEIETSIPEQKHQQKLSLPSSGSTLTKQNTVDDKNQDSQQIPPVNYGLSDTPSVINSSGCSKVFQILYKNEEVVLRDVISFRAHLLGEFSLSHHIDF